jgi:predicted Zn-dependent protease
VNRLDWPDKHYFAAAVGWFELGNVREAQAELDLISAGHQTHPDVLELRWTICAQEERWNDALRAARALLDNAPQRSSGWLHHAYALRRAPDGGVKKAWDALLPAFERFPKEATIPYNLSCYACLMQQYEEARIWLQRAFVAGGKRKMKVMALADPDLKPLWKEIREL